MINKTKKKLKFLDKENQNNLKDGIINGRKKYAKEFKKQFHGSYVGYLGDFSKRKQLFEIRSKTSKTNKKTKLQASSQLRRLSFDWRQVFLPLGLCIKRKNEPQHEKTNNRLSDQVWNKPGCTGTGAG